ncbi:MAG: hypothetical protein QUS35_00545 [bacterium]|nr:hypothetical protein [bacterium]
MMPVFRRAALAVAWSLAFPVIAASAVSAAAGSDTSGVRPPAVSGEIDLGNIEIQGRIEQPNVILVPTRLDPGLGDTSLDRSFKDEIRGGAGGFMSPDTSIRRVEPAPSIRNSIKKKRK